MICDHGLPELDGYAVARAIRSERMLRRTRLIAPSGYAQYEDDQRAGEAGFDHRLAKPEDMESLDRLLAEIPDEPE